MTETTEQRQNHPSNACYQCGEKMENYHPPEPGSPGIGICPEHGVSFDRTYVGPGSKYND